MEVDRVRIGGCHYVGEDDFKGLLHIRAGDLADDGLDGDSRRATVFQVLGDVGDRLVQGNREDYAFGQRQDIRQVGIDEHHTGVREPPLGGLHHGVDLAFEPAPQRRRDAHPQAVESRGRGNRRAGDDRVEQRHIGDGSGHGADGVQGVAERAHPRTAVAVPGTSGRGSQSGDAVERRRDPHRGAGVAAQPCGRDAGRDRGPGATGRAPGDARGVVRVGGGSGERGEVGGRDAEGELVHVGFAEDDRARVQQRPEHGRVLGGAEVVQRGCSGGRGQVFGVDVVFDDDGQAG